MLWVVSSIQKDRFRTKVETNDQQVFIQD